MSSFDSCARTFQEGKVINNIQYLRQMVLNKTRNRGRPGSWVTFAQRNHFSIYIQLSRKAPKTSSPFADTILQLFPTWIFHGGELHGNRHLIEHRNNLRSQSHSVYHSQHSMIKSCRINIQIRNCVEYWEFLMEKFQRSLLTQIGS